VQSVHAATEKLKNGMANFNTHQHPIRLWSAISRNFDESLQKKMPVRHDFIARQHNTRMQSAMLLMAKPKHRLGRALFLLKNRFLALVLPNLNRSW